MPEERRAGSIPPDRRRLAVGVTAATAASIVLGSLAVNYFAGSPINWVWIVVATLLTTMLIMLFLWVRLSD